MNMHELLHWLRTNGIDYNHTYDAQNQYLRVDDTTHDISRYIINNYDYDLIRIEKVLFWYNVYIQDEL